MLKSPQLNYFPYQKRCGNLRSLTISRINSRIEISRGKLFPVSSLIPDLPELNYFPFQKRSGIFQSLTISRINACLGSSRGELFPVSKRVLNIQPLNYFPFQLLFILILTSDTTLNKKKIYMCIAMNQLIQSPKLRLLIKHLSTSSFVLRGTENPLYLRWYPPISLTTCSCTLSGTFLNCSKQIRFNCMRYRL